MQLVEHQVIARGDPRDRPIDPVACAAKNLWNAANYRVRQSFLPEGKDLHTAAISHVIKDHEAYQALARTVSNQVLLQVHTAWVAFFAAMQAWRDHPEQSPGRPKLPQ
jgi:transposase